MERRNLDHAFPPFAPGLPSVYERAGFDVNRDARSQSQSPSIRSTRSGWSWNRSPHVPTGSFPSPPSGPGAFANAGPRPVTAPESRSQTQLPPMPAKSIRRTASGASSAGSTAAPHSVDSLPPSSLNNRLVGHGGHNPVGSGAASGAPTTNSLPSSKSGFGSATQYAPSTDASGSYVGTGSARPSRNNSNGSASLARVHPQQPPQPMMHREAAASTDTFNFGVRSGVSADAENHAQSMARYEDRSKPAYPIDFEEEGSSNQGFRSNRRSDETDGTDNSFYLGSGDSRTQSSLSGDEYTEPSMAHIKSEGWAPPILVNDDSSPAQALALGPGPSFGGRAMPHIGPGLLREPDGPVNRFSTTSSIYTPSPDLAAPVGTSMNAARHPSPANLTGHDPVGFPLPSKAPGRALAPSRGGAGALPDPPAEPGVPGSKICRGCHERIEGKSIYSKDGNMSGRWHRSCFKCTRCTSSLTNEVYVFSDSPYCYECYHVVNESMCRSCGLGIEGDCLETCAAQPGISDAPQAIRYHIDCLKCHTCALPLMDTYYELDGETLCAEHGAGEHYGTSRAQKRITRLMMI